MNANKITFIQTTSEERLEETCQCLKLIHSYVDEIFVVSPVGFDALLHSVNRNKVNIIIRDWHDNLPKYLNHALNEVKEGWILRFDPDEYPNQKFLEHLREIIAGSGNGLKYNWVKLNCHDVIDDELPLRTTYYRAVFWKWYKALKYVGVGIGVDHEQLVGVPFLPLKLPDSMFYTHIRTTLEMRQGSFRRFHVAGGGNALGPDNPLWPEYRDLIKQISPDLLEWKNMLPYIRFGHVDQRLVDFMNKHRNRNVIPDADQEFREAWEFYFVLLHPNENVSNLMQKPDDPPPDTENHRFIEETYLKILGRHADTEGKKAYAQLIKDGKLKKEDFENVLMQSEEYLQLVTA